MKIQLSDHFDFKRLIRFVIPSIIMMVFTSIYSVVDGFFVSNFAGKTAFAAVNFIMPFLVLLGGLGFLFGTGGSALVAMTLGEGKKEKANQIFTFLVIFSFALGIAVSIIGIIFAPNIAALLGAEGDMLDLSVQYARIILIMNPFFMMQMEFQSFFVTAEKPKLGMWTTIASGISNMVMDFVLVGLLQWGVVGAALATGASYLVGGLFPLVYFGRKNNSLLRFCKTRFDGRALWRTCTNGCSELMSNISSSIVGMLYNIQLLKYAGEDGVAAYGVIMYVTMIFLAIFIGYTVGTAPIVGFNYGARKYPELKNILKKSGIIIVLTSIAMVLAGFFCARPLGQLFAGYDENLLAMTVHGFRIYSFCYLFAGISIYGSSFFTALNNGPISALISFLRTLVFQVAAVMIMPIFFGLDGIWESMIVAEVVSAVLTLSLLIGLRNKYGYWPKEKS